MMDLTENEILALLEYFTETKRWLDCDNERDALNTANKLLYVKGNNSLGVNSLFKGLERFQKNVFTGKLMTQNDIDNCLVGKDNVLIPSKKPILSNEEIDFELRYICDDYDSVKNIKPIPFKNITSYFTTGKEINFVGKYRRDLEKPNWHHYETKDGNIIHCRKEFLYLVEESEVKNG